MRINHAYTPKLTLDVSQVKRIELRPEDTPSTAYLAPFLDGKPFSKLTEINLADEKVEEILKVLRRQRLIFEISRDIYDQMKPHWQGNKEYLLIQLVKIVEDFIDSNKIFIYSLAYREDDLRRRLLILLNMNKIVTHLFNAIKFENTQQVAPIFNKEMPSKSTGNMMTWFTSRPCEHIQKSHINQIVVDSTWEMTEAFELDRNPNVIAWAKNDHLGFVINYVYRGIIHKYYPDFLIKLQNGKTLILEVKGKDDQQNRTKREYLDEWIKAVNGDGRFGTWCWDVSFRTSDIRDKIKKHLG